MARPVLLEDLRKAHTGNYGVILSLLGCLDDGLRVKRLVDRIIDNCVLCFQSCVDFERICFAGDHVSNLREEILTFRLKYSLATMEGEEMEYLLSRAGKAMEK
jgi:hypothetical protein